jgi:hypothetical protein
MKIHKAGDVYKTKPVDHLLKKYLKQAGAKWEQFWNSPSVPTVKLRAIFLLAIKDFDEKKITLDDLSTIADSLYYDIYSTRKNKKKKWGPNQIAQLDRELSRALDIASELAYNNWQNKGGVSESLSLIKSYYKDRRFVIERILK